MNSHKMKIVLIKSHLVWLLGFNYLIDQFYSNNYQLILDNRTSEKKKKR